MPIPNEHTADFVAGPSSAKWQAVQACTLFSGHGRGCVPTRQPCSRQGGTAPNMLAAAWLTALQHAGEDVGHYGGSYKVTFDLYKKYGDMRLLDTPICGAPALQYPAVCKRPVQHC